jgi:hypothetical protein
LFRLVVPATSIFIVTILSLIAVLFSDERAPVARFLNRHGNTLLIVELIVVVVLSFVAMAVDRWRTLRDIACVQDRAKSSEQVPNVPVTVHHQSKIPQSEEK